VKHFWKRYWAWSDKLNEPLHKHKDRIALYVILCQSVLVTVALLNLPRDDKMVMICRYNESIDSIICEQI
jgi:hypothetical protein